MSIAKEQLIDFLRDKEFRGHFTSAQAYELLAVQIRQLREKYQWTQAELGERAGMQQVQVSRAENPDYKGTRISTLSKLADAFDVALIVRLAPFSELLDWVAKLSSRSFEPASFEEELRTSEYGTGQIRMFASAALGPADDSKVTDFGAYKRALQTAGEYPSLIIEGSPVLERRPQHATPETYTKAS